MIFKIIFEVRDGVNNLPASWEVSYAHRPNMGEATFTPPTNWQVFSGVFYK
jgi:hypothetical protein